MADLWRQEIKKLHEFMGAHPEIVVTSQKTETPEESRADFYAAFDKVRAAFTEEKYPALLEESVAIVEAYRKAMAEAVATGYLETILSPVDFDRFLQDPRATLLRPVFNPLFDLLAGAISDDIFETRAASSIESLAQEFKTAAYEKYLVLSLINFFKPDKFFECAPKIPDIGRLANLRKLDHFTAVEIPLPTETRGLSWRMDDTPQIIVPSFIMRSTVREKDRYVAVRFGFRTPTNPAKDPPREREWLSVSPDFKLESDVILVYMGDNLLSVSLLAEVRRVCRPDVFIKYRVDESQDLNEWLERARLNNEALRPKQGFRLVSRVP